MGITAHAPHFRPLSEEISIEIHNQSFNVCPIKLFFYPLHSKFSSYLHYSSCPYSIPSQLHRPTLGPWIENLFIRDFIKRPFKYFNGIIPLFVQWSDYHLHFKSEINKDTNNRFTEEEIFRNVTSILRKNVLYMVISQANYGIRFLTTSHPNILIFSAGGEGDIPIPLIKGELAFRETDRGTFPKIDVGFYGTIDHGHRKKSLDSLSALLKSSPYSYRMGPSRTWIDDM